MNELRSLPDSPAKRGRRWMPKSISYAFGEPIVELAELPDAPGPFVSDLDLSGASSTMRLPLMDVAVPDDLDQRAPAGFIFHLPRSGSTLVARMLTTLPGCACVVEPEPINALLSRPEARAQFKPEWLRRLVRLYVAALTGNRPHLFVKLSSWAVLRAPLFVEAFPSVRSCFVHRDPVEVLVQLLDRPAGWMARHARPFILGDFPGVATMPVEEYCARTLGRFLEAAAAGAPGMRAVPYEGVPANVLATARDHFGMDVSASDREAMLKVAQYDAEDWSSQRPYVDPADAIRDRATPEMRMMLERFTQGPRHRLFTSRPL